MGEDLDRYRHDVCAAEKHTHGEEGELQCILANLARRLAGRAAQPGDAAST